MKIIMTNRQYGRNLCKAFALRPTIIMPFHVSFIYKCSMFYCFQVETNWPKTIITANHGTHGVLHPPIEKVPFAASQRLHERTHNLPCRRTKAFWHSSAYGNPLLPYCYITSMLYRVLETFHQVVINRLPHGNNTYVVHTHFSLLPCKDTVILVKSQILEQRNRFFSTLSQ